MRVLQKSTFHINRVYGFRGRFRLFFRGLGSSFSAFLSFESKQQHQQQQQLLPGLAASGPQPEAPCPGGGTQLIPGVAGSIS